MKWEYKTVTHPSEGLYHPEFLDTLGEEGWELCGVRDVRRGGRIDILYYFKRMIVPEFHVVTSADLKAEDMAMLRDMFSVGPLPVDRHIERIKSGESTVNQARYEAFQDRKHPRGHTREEAEAKDIPGRKVIFDPQQPPEERIEVLTRTRCLHCGRHYLSVYDIGGALIGSTQCAPPPFANQPHLWKEYDK